jgi:hypothetical protein
MQVEHWKAFKFSDSEPPSDRLVRWSLKLQEYDMEIQHRPGRVHSNVDPLSRMELINLIINKLMPV